MYLYIKAPAKLNLFLRVLNRRRDGYHNIQTLLERIDLSDNIHIATANDSKIHLSCRGLWVCRREDNLVYKTVCLLRHRFSIHEGVSIHLHKNIPVGAGLGGGSSDAAAILLGLNRLWGLKLAKKDLLEIAFKIGSDVPFFVKENSFSLATGRGQILRQIDIGIRLWHILVVPKKHLSTKVVYRQFDRLKPVKSSYALSASWVTGLTHSASLSVNPDNNTEGLTKQDKGVKIWICLLAKLSCFKRWSNFVMLNYNSLEPAATHLLPQILKIKETLHSLGVKAVGMSGSGPSVFGILDSRKEGESLRASLARFRDWRSFIVRTY